MGNWSHDSHLQLSSLQIRVCVLYCGTVIHDYSSHKTDVAGGNNENKTPKVVSVGCVGLWKNNGVLSKFGKIRETGKMCHVMSIDE